MNVPHSFNLHSQAFNAEFVEFVWQIPHIKRGKNQVVYKIHKDGTVLLQEGTINESGDYFYDNYTFPYIFSTKYISAKELTKLKDEVVEYLKS